MTLKQTGLQLAITAAGSLPKFAQALKVTKSEVEGWLHADEPKKRAVSAVDRAVEAAGSWEKLALALGVTRQAVGQWLNQGYVPLARAKEIEHLFGIPRTELVSAKVRSLMGVGGDL